MVKEHCGARAEILYSFLAVFHVFSTLVLKGFSTLVLQVYGDNAVCGQQT